MIYSMVHLFDKAASYSVYLQGIEFAYGLIDKSED